MKIKNTFVELEKREKNIKKSFTVEYKNTKNNSYKKKLPITTIAIKKRPKMNEPPYTKQKEKT